MQFTSLSIAWKRHEREGRGYPLTAQSIRLDLSPSKLVKELAKLPKTGLPVTWNVDNATLFFLNSHLMHWNCRTRICFIKTYLHVTIPIMDLSFLLAIILSSLFVSSYLSVGDSAVKGSNNSTSSLLPSLESSHLSALKTKLKKYFL